MSEHKTFADEISKLFDELKRYVEIRFDLLKLDFAEKIVFLLTRFYIAVVFLVLLPLVLFFLSFALALWIGEELGHAYLGFLIVGGVLILIGIVIFLLRRIILERPVTKMIIKILFDEK